MSHDELLISVNMNVQTTGGLEQNTNALRAVVELHKPITLYKFQSEEISSVECSHCTYGPLSDNYNYPCPTIQAIEKELK